MTTDPHPSTSTDPGLERGPLTSSPLYKLIPGTETPAPWTPVGTDVKARRRLAADQTLVADPWIVHDPHVRPATKQTSEPIASRVPKIRSMAVLGDSISHGVQGGVVARPSSAWPSLLARMLDIEISIARPRTFAPKYLETALLFSNGPTRHPVGDVIWPKLRDLINPFPAKPIERAPDVIAVTGYDLKDALEGPRHRSGYTEDVLPADPSAPNGSLPPIKALALRCEQQVPDLLVVELGANCVLSSVVSLDARWNHGDAPTGDKTGATLREGTVWTPEYFQRLYTQLVNDVAKLGIPNVVLTTVPHVSVAPCVSGYGQFPQAQTEGEQPYFPEYRWLFDGGSGVSLRDLSGETVQTLDQTIDVYNRIIQDLVRKQRKSQPECNWMLFDLCGVLDHIALKRNAPPAGGVRRRAFPDVLFDGLKLAGPASLADPAQEHLDSRFMLTDPKRQPDQDMTKVEGGLVSLDGVHPSAAGHLVLARALAFALERGGVELPRGWYDAIDVKKLLGKDPLLRWLVDHNQEALPTRRWLSWFGNLGPLLDRLALSIGRRLQN